MLIVNRYENQPYSYMPIWVLLITDLNIKNEDSLNTYLLHFYTK